MTQDQRPPTGTRPPTARGIPTDLPQELSLRRGHLLLVATGSVAANLLTSWTLLLPRWYGCTIQVCLTEAAAALVSRDTLAATTHSPVWGPGWHTSEGRVLHRDLALWADMVIVAPATANFVAKCARCMADSLALATVVSTDAPVLIAPALPERTVSLPSMQRNFKLLEEDGYHVVPPQFGTAVFDGNWTPGGMANLGTILRAAADILAQQPVSAG